MMTEETIVDSIESQPADTSKLSYLKSLVKTTNLTTSL